MNEGRYRGGCSVLEELGYCYGCCSSCHEDAEWNDGSYPLPELYLPNGDWLTCCCGCDDNIDLDELLRRLDEREATNTHK